MSVIKKSRDHHVELVVAVEVAGRQGIGLVRFKNHKEKEFRYLRVIS